MTTLKPAAIRIIKNATGNKTEYMYVDLRSEEEVEKALKNNKDYMGLLYIEVFRTSVRVGCRGWRKGATGDSPGSRRKMKRRKM
uniref:RRM domain-containing protein n=1 Tax=Hucho hucho TaxID=62062 RepID=A0A4W5NEK5_9TELE